MTKEEVLAALFKAAPEMMTHVRADRAWLWYCGPTLAGKDGEGKRAVLKKLGFRFAPRGRTVDGMVGYWAHSCSAPTPRKWKNKNRPGVPAVTVTAAQSDEDFAAALLAAL